MFDKESADWVDVMTVKEFAANVVCGAFTPEDGVGYWGNETHYSREFYCFDLPPKEATHCHWFNK